MPSGGVELPEVSWCLGWHPAPRAQKRQQLGLLVTTSTTAPFLRDPKDQSLHLRVPVTEQCLRSCTPDGISETVASILCVWRSQACLPFLGSNERGGRSVQSQLVGVRPGFEKGVDDALMPLPPRADRG